MSRVSQSLNGTVASRGTNSSHQASSALGARRLVLAGGVQGLGVRPAIFRLATQLALNGSVRNTSGGVEIEIEGPADKLNRFEDLLPSSLPAAASPVRLKSEPLTPDGREHFTILKEPSHGPLSVLMPEDRGLCPGCAEEITSRDDRRHGYPFTSCTQCGPRYTVIRAMPFERADTTMAEFPLCPACRGEYERPGDRRFHAQTTACEKCGPRVWGKADGGSNKQYAEEALKAAVANLAAGKIVALRGLGGYQLLVDATNEAAVRRLRERKCRRAKPLAVMVASIAAARKLAHFDEHEIAAFNDPSAPIVLVRAHSGNGLAASIHPHLDTLGLMRPTTPLHAILTRDFRRPLVCTSGNREGDPLEFDVAAAEKQLAGIADFWLHHDRKIARPIDDSVVRVIAGRRVTIRLARGLAPLSLDLPAMPPTIAVGGFLKSAAAWSNGAQAVLGPHVGDQETLAARQRFLAHLKDWHRLYRFRPAQLVHDMHPEYFSTQWAKKQPVRQLAVQHHHAHVVAGMLEHGWLDRRVLGVAWDGTGYGSDGTIWGGEFLVGSASGFERVARVRPFSLPGGEAAIREPWRIAVSVSRQLDRPINLALWPGWGVNAMQVESVARIVGRPQLSPVTSSAGRLIDAAAALILGIDRADFDGQAAMRLEAAADGDARGWYHFPVTDDELPELDWRPLFTGLLADQQRGVDPATLAMRFHRSLAYGIIGVCRRWSELRVVLSGGVFQNRLLTELVAEMIDSKCQKLGQPGIIPPNDGGLAAGQLAIAAAQRGDLSCA
ncbi:MAG: carbamoyltransferase HypF [Pirellulales bacterium]